MQLAMQTFLLCLAAVNLAVVAVVAFDQIRGQRLIVRLADFTPSRRLELPAVSVIAAARNEQEHIERAARSLLGLDYPDLEIILLNDRSTDRTGEIIDAVAAADSRLTVLHIQELPPGWLGKNHALHYGARRARGDLLLFTDADVVMDPQTLKRAVQYMLDAPFDHIAMSPSVSMPNLLLEAFASAFSAILSVYMRPWKARDPESAGHVGIGAFNLVRADVYRAVGGHEPIAMRPDDDLKLGKLIKKNGYRQDLVNGAELIDVPWYGSIGELARGLEKNAFAGFDYRVTAVVGLTAMVLAFDVWPFLAVWLPLWPATRLMCLAVTLLLLRLAWIGAEAIGARRLTSLGFPAAVAMFTVIQWRAMILALINNGIRWRDTHYPLAELKANKL